MWTFSNEFMEKRVAPSHDIDKRQHTRYLILRIIT